jgi:hypothetical protein
MITLTKRQQEIIDFVSQQTEPPSIADVARCFEMSYPGAQHHIFALIKKKVFVLNGQRQIVPYKEKPISECQICKNACNTERWFNFMIIKYGLTREVFTFTLCPSCSSFLLHLIPEEDFK